MSRQARLLAAAVAVVTLVATAVAAASPSSGSPRTALIQRLLRAAAGLDATGGGGQGQPAGNHTRQLGELNLPGGLHADVWAYKTFAYVGTWSGPCPGTGVKIIDVSNPARPRQVATAAGYANTSAEDMQVLSVHTAAFTGDLLGV